MTTKHTPGPWHITRDDLDSGEISLHITHKATNVCVIYSYDREDKGRNEMADANLIAASPDLLAACEAVMADANDPFFQVAGCLPSETYAVVRAAIAKAKGEKA